jgi:hypothetical protein
VAQWTFNSAGPPFGPIVADTGTPADRLSAIGVTTASFVSGTGSSDPTTETNLALNLTGFPAQGTAHRSAGIQFSVDTTGYSNLVLTFDQQNTPNASGQQAVQYSLNGGVIWTDAAILGYSNANWYDGQGVNLSAIPGAANNPNLQLRIVSAMNGPMYVGTMVPYDPTGSWNLDMVTVSGTAVPVVSVSASDAIEGSATGGFTLTRTGDLTNSLIVTYSVGGTANPGTDYTPLSGTATFNPGSNVVDVPVTPLTPNGGTTVVLTVTGGGTSYFADPTAGSATTNIDALPETVSVVQLADATEGGSAGTLRFLRSGDLSQQLTATYTVSGTAVAGLNYTALSGTVTFQPGSDHTDVSVAALPDGNADPTLTVTATLNPSTIYPLGNDSDTVFIKDSSTQQDYWTDADHNGLWEDPMNWSTGVVPTATTDVYFSGGSTPYYSNDPCTDVGNGVSSLYGLHFINNYTGTATLAGALSVGTFEQTSGTLNQPSAGQNLTITNAMIWTGGTLNAINNGASVNISGAVGRIAPLNGGTISTASTLNIINGADLTVLSGVLNFTSGNGMFIDATVNMYEPINNNVDVQITNSTSNSKIALGSNGKLNISKPNQDATGGVIFWVPILNNGGQFWVGAGIHVRVHGNAQGGTSESIVQTAGTTTLPTTSAFETANGMAVTGGELTIVGVVNSRQKATIKADNGTFRFSGGTLGFTSFAPFTIIYAQLLIEGNVTWNAGTFVPRLQVIPGDTATSPSDTWVATGTFTFGTIPGVASPVLAPSCNTNAATSGNNWVPITRQMGFAGNAPPGLPAVGWITFTTETFAQGKVTRLKIKRT